MIVSLMPRINQLLLAACFRLLDEALGTGQMRGIVRRNLDGQSEIQVINVTKSATKKSLMPKIVVQSISIFTE